MANPNIIAPRKTYKILVVLYPMLLTSSLEFADLKNHFQLNKPARTEIIPARMKIILMIIWAAII